MSSCDQTPKSKVPYVSIIIPAYNAEETIECCLQSVMGQTYSDWECIVINDGATDNTGEIIHRFADRDKRVKEIVQVNSGVSSARNHGIDLSAGEMITFLDADDYWELTYLEKLVGLQKKYQTDLTMCEFTNISSTGSRRERRDILDHDLYAKGKDAFEAFFHLFLWNGRKQRPGGPCCKLYKREIIINNSIAFNRDIHYNEDFLFNLWYFQYVSSFFYLHESLYNRLILDTSAIHRYRPDIYMELEKLFGDYRQLRVKFGWECREERRFFLHLLSDLPFNLFICRRENPLSYRDRRKGYFAFIQKPDIYSEFEKITLSDCTDIKSKVKLLLLKSKQFFLMGTLYKK